MGFSFYGHHKKRDADKEKHLRRFHKVIPLIESPLQGADNENLVFSQRHEANHVELFFDLFFVANLATFTAYHSITDLSYLVAYMGFFGILWATWFQITLHDVRFARDSLYERICKTIQFIVFVGLALVGSSFNPSAKNANNTNFRILCYTLVISRTLLGIQYVVVLLYTIRARYHKLYLPLGLMIAIYFVNAGAFAAMTPAFQEGDEAHRSVYVVWYIVMLLEAVAIITISCFWRMLSFKKTHLMERMSLLTLIVIGEGAIGVTKTVSKLMGKHGLDVEGCFLIMSIIVVLVFLWALYFDNFPHGHYGTIRQQIWSVLHFPLQLSMIGVVEGSQQLAIARYTLKNVFKFEKSIVKYCDDNYDGEKLRDALLALIYYFKFDSKSDTYDKYQSLIEQTYDIGNATGICSPANATTYDDEHYPQLINNFFVSGVTAIYKGLGMKLPVGEGDEYAPIVITSQSWGVVYLYYWSSFCLLIICSIVFLILIRRHKSDLFDWVSIMVRLLVLIVGALMMALMAKVNIVAEFISSPAVIPVVVSLLFLILLFDKLSSSYCNLQLKKSGEPYALEYEEHHHHEKSHESVTHVSGAHMPLYDHDDTLAEHHHRNSSWSTYSDTTPLAGMSTEYFGGRQSYVMSPLMSPPITTPPVASGQRNEGYMAVSTGQNYGA